VVVVEVVGAHLHWFIFIITLNFISFGVLSQIVIPNEMSIFTNFFAL
jgi:hypothetical protein